MNRTAPVPVPAPVQEVPTGEKLLQCPVAEIQSRQPAAVTKPKPPLDQLEDLLGRFPANMTAPFPVPAPVQEVPKGGGLLQCLGDEIQSPAGGSYETEASSGSVGGSAQTVSSEQGCPSSGPSSGSGGADGGKFPTGSGGRNSESPAGGISETEASSGSVGGCARTVASEQGCPGSGSSSGS